MTKLVKKGRIYATIAVKLLTKDIVSVAFGVAGAAAAAADIATGAVVAYDDVVGTLISLTLTKDKGAYLGASVGSASCSTTQSSQPRW